MPTRLSRPINQETPYYLAAVAGLVVGFAWLGIWSFTGHLPAVRSRDFYTSAAQIFPVLLLAFGIERNFFERGDSGSLSATAAAAYAFVILGSSAGLVLALVALMTTGSPSQTVAAVATFGVVEGIACCLTLIVAYSANTLGVFDILKQGSAGRPTLAVSGAARSLAVGAACLAFGAFLGAYFLGIWLTIDPIASPRIALFVGAVGLALSCGAFWVGSERRTTRALRGTQVALTAAWLGLSLFFGWVLSLDPDSYGPFLGVAGISCVVLGFPIGMLMAIVSRRQIAAARRRHHPEGAERRRSRQGRRAGKRRR